jgi:hypothetical protein
MTSYAASVTSMKDSDLPSHDAMERHSVPAIT